ncbi:hypothetical protein ThidrDRAFT_4703, partial [Thiorhodococcus drewsii AZ1]
MQATTTLTITGLKRMLRPTRTGRAEIDIKKISGEGFARCLDDREQIAKIRARAGFQGVQRWQPCRRMEHLHILCKRPGNYRIDPSGLMSSIVR